MMVVMLVGFDRRSLNLGRCCSGRWTGGLPGRRRGEVGLLLAWVQHHRRCCGGGCSSCGRGRVLLDRMDRGGRTWVLQVVLARVMVVVKVGRWEMRELMMVVRMMSRHRRSAAVVSGHHFCGITGRSFAKSHKLHDSWQKKERYGKRRKRPAANI